VNSSHRTDRHELIVVTGASTGIGAASARELARMGFHVLAGVRREVDADALRGLGIEGIEPRILDITVESDVAAIANRVADDPLHRPLRALVNNAGIPINAPVESLPMAQWRRLFDVNLFGHVAMLGHRGEHQFRRREGGLADLWRVRRFEVRPRGRQ
jgi:NAD(P)-dependent dehydrogenase (short-subunit alcohol dehydrogenase family)